MSYQKDRDEFIGVIVDEVTAILCARARDGMRPNSNEGVSLARLILRNAATIQRIAVKDCNEPLTDGDRKTDAACQARIKAACEPWGIKPHFGGDPRGCCVKLILPSGRWNSWGGKEDGFCVPTR